MVLVHGMGELKSIKHEHFVREYIKTGNAAEAYRRVAARFFDPKKPLKKLAGARVTACLLRKNPKIIQRERELREIMAKKSEITIEKILTDLQEAMGMARKLDKPNEIITAAMSQAKLVGLLRDRVETGAVGDFDSAESVADILEKIGQELGPEKALALAEAWGLDDAKTLHSETKAEPEDSALAEAIPPSDAVN